MMIYTSRKLQLVPWFAIGIGAGIKMDWNRNHPKHDTVQREDKDFYIMGLRPITEQKGIQQKLCYCPVSNVMNYY